MVNINLLRVIACAIRSCGGHINHHHLTFVLYFYAYHHRLPAASISSTIIVTRNQAVIPFAAEKIRVGRDYQAVCPELEPVDQRRPELISDRALLVWSPTCDISDIKCK